ncbi:MAG: hypothetical protein BRC27_01295 [Nanohaloarchaea archaeon SW_10_44_10]|nr:MAG: hypothetical protein BRC27_01295 [Nanohaloarchaea archaeon SW_10_44_10]
MQDPWKFLGFPAAAVGGYLIASTQMAVFLKETTNLSQFFSELAIVALTGFLAGFLVDEIIPTYIEHVRDQGSGAELGGDTDDDFNFD